MVYDNSLKNVYDTLFHDLKIVLFFTHFPFDLNVINTDEVIYKYI